MPHDQVWITQTDERLKVLRRDVDAHHKRLGAVEEEVDALQSDFRVVTTKQLTGIAIVQLVLALVIGLGGALIGGWASSYFAN